MEQEVFRRKGGSWLGAVRNWVKWHVLRGDSLIWGTDAKTTLVTTHGNLNLEDVEEIAAKVGWAVQEMVLNKLNGRIQMCEFALAESAYGKNLVGWERSAMEGKLKLLKSLFVEIEGNP